jgi:hypothetical protein
MIEQDRSPQQRFPEYHFEIDMLVKNLDAATIRFSDKCRFILGSDKRWRHIRRGQRCEDRVTAEEKLRESLMIWGRHRAQQ